MTMIKAERATVKFFDGLEIDGYMMPDGSFRVSMSGASVLVGFAANWLTRTIGGSGTVIKALQGRGFSAETIETRTVTSTGGESRNKTISLRDFNILIHYAASKDKPQAIALQSALTDMALNDFFRDAFGMRPLSIDEKRERLYQAFAATLTHKDWLEWDRSDVLEIEEHQRFLRLGR